MKLPVRILSGIGQNINTLSQVIIICLSLLLLHPDMASWFQTDFLASVKPFILKSGWLLGVIIGAIGAFGLKWEMQGYCWLGYCTIYGITLTRTALWSPPEMRIEKVLTNSATLEMFGFGIFAVFLLLSRFQKDVIDSCRFIVATFAVVNIAIATAQFFLLQFSSKNSVMHDVLIPHRLVVRSGDVLYATAIRLNGLFKNPNSLGASVLLSWPAAFFVVRQFKARAVVAGLIPLFAGVAVAGSYSRAAYIGVLIQLLQLLIISGKALNRLQNKIRVIGGMLLLAGFIWGMFLPFATTRVASIGNLEEASIANRLTVYFDAVKILLLRPLQGWGISGFASVFNRYWKPAGLEYHYMDVHSALLNSALETGLIGIVLFFGILFNAFPWFFREVFREVRQIPDWLTVGLTGAIIPLFSDNFSTLPGVFVPLLFLLCATAITVQRQSNDSVILSQPAKYRSMGVIVLVSVWIILGFVFPISDRFQKTTIHTSLKQSTASQVDSVLWYAEDSLRDLEFCSNSDTEIPEKEFRFLKIALALKNRIRNSESYYEQQLSIQNPNLKHVGIMKELVYKMLHDCNQDAALTLEKLVGTSVVDAEFLNFLESERVNCSLKAITPRTGLLLFRKILAADLQGVTTIYGTCFMSEGTPNNISHIAKYSFTSFSQDSNRNLQVNIVSSDNQRWGACIFAFNKAGSKSSSLLPRVCNEFLTRCERAFCL